MAQQPVPEEMPGRGAFYGGMAFFIAAVLSLLWFLHDKTIWSGGLLAFMVLNVGILWWEAESKKSKWIKRRHKSK